VIVVPADLVPEALRIRYGSTPAGLDAATVERLEDAGLLVGGRLHPVAADLAEILDDPALIVRVDVVAGSRRSKATVWATPESAVVGGSRPDGAYELGHARVSALTFHIADLAGVRMRPSPLTGVVLDATARQSHGLKRLVYDASPGRFSVRARWRDDSIHDCTVDAVDGGALGYWLAGDGKLVGASTGTVVRAIAAALPER
jgi:hypothetical protein